MKTGKWFTITAAVCGIVLALSLPAQPQSTAEPDSAIQRRLDEIDQKQRIWERKWELAKEEAAAKAKETPVLAAGKDGFSLKSADGKFQLKLRGYVQTDGRFFLADDEKRFVNTFLMRRIRPIFEGTLDKNFDFYLMLDFSGTAVIQDAYVDFHYWPQARLRLGKLKAPFGLERLQSGANLLFAERALPANLGPNRDVGVQLHGELAKGAITYVAGIFNGVADGASADTDNGDEKDFAIRFFILPFKNTSTALQGLGAGIAGSSGTQQGSIASPSLPSYRTPAQQTYFSYRADATAAGTAIASGKRTRLSPQGYYYSGPFGLFGEYVIAKQEVARGTALANLQNDAWQVAASYIITGQKVNYRGVTLPKPFEPKESSWGAFELAARYNKLKVAENAFPIFADIARSAQTATAWAVGINWYLNRNSKFTVDYEQTKFDGGATAGNRQTEKIIFSRLQLSY
ncbi:MAG: OprO/OprP family phosphate-selective porin [bacterium]